MAEQKLHQEERLRRAQERAKAEPKKKVWTFVSVSVGLQTVTSNFQDSLCNEMIYYGGVSILGLVTFAVLFVSLVFILIPYWIVAF